MTRKTKQMLEKEVALLKSKNEELQEEIYELRYEKDYWFVKSERFARLNLHEQLKNMDCFKENESAYERIRNNGREFRRCNLWC